MNDYFCVLPFFGYEFSPNHGTHCCLLPRGHDINEIRQDMLDKKRSPQCSACWKLEDSGLTSDRQLKNSALDFYSNRDIRFIEEDARQGKYETTLIKLITSNKCNSTCVTCNSGASTAWGELSKKGKIIDINPKSALSQETIDGLSFDKLVGINFIGGEPLYEQRNFYIIENLIKHNNTDCFISFTTNGSVGINSVNKNLLSQFKNINIGLSIDGIGPVFEYMRYPLKWKKLLANLEFFKTITNNISVNQCTSNVNVYYYDETTAWFESQNLSYHHNPVITPSYFRPSALPLRVKEKIRSMSDKTEAFVSTHTDEDDRDFQLMLVELKKQDQLKNIDIKNYLPDFWNLILQNS